MNGVHAVNPAQHLRISFDRSGVLINSTNLQFGLQVRAVGYGLSLTPINQVVPRIRANRVLYSHVNMDESYTNGPLGLEQRFIISHAPTRNAVGPLTLSMTLSGNARASLAKGSKSVIFSGYGLQKLRYAGLAAMDARGRRLHSWLAINSDGQILLRVDTRGAQYPLNIDPFIQQVKFTFSSEIGEGRCGSSVALSSDGNTAAVGCPENNSGIGAVYIFTRFGTEWTQQTEITNPEGTSEGFAGQVALSSNGNTALFGSGDEPWIYTRSGSTWTKQERLKPTEVEKAFGGTIALSGEGNTAILGDEEDKSKVGSVWIFTLSEGKWAQQGPKFTGTGYTECTRGGETKEHFGESLALSSNGNTALVGASTDNCYIGAAWVFTRSEGKWTQQRSKLTGSEEVGEAYFGNSVSLSSNGNTALIGGKYDNDYIGAAWVFTRSGTSWSQQAKLKGIGERGTEEFPHQGWFGSSVTLSPEGNAALIGGVAEERTEEGGTSGAAWAFTRSGSSWSQVGPHIVDGEYGVRGEFGSAVALSAGGSTALVGAQNLAEGGGAWAFSYLASTEELYGPENEGEPNQHRACSGRPVNCATGNQVETQTDLAVGGRGPGLKLTRTYNSQLAATQTEPGPFGYGWTGPYSAHLVINEEADTAIVHQDNGSTVTFDITTSKTYVGAAPWVEATLIKEGSTYVYTLPDQSKLDFNSVGQLTSETERNGNSISMSYNTEKHLESVTDGSGRKLTFSYNGEGLVESAKDPMGHIVKYTYESKNLTSVTQPGEASLRWQFKYNSEHEMTSETDGREHTVTTEYDSSHRVMSQTDAMERKRNWEYSTTESGEAETTITEPNGSTTVELFNSTGLLTEITRDAGTSEAARTYYEYNPADNLIATTDANYHTTTYGYDSAGDRTSEKDANSNETKWTYDSKHDIETMTTPKGETTTIKRNADGDPEVIERPAPSSKIQKITYKYDSYGDLTSETDPLERVRKFEYDSYGDRESETDAEGDKRTWKYNEDSQEISTVSPRGNVAGGEPLKYTTKIERDAQGRPLTITDPLGHATKYTYDGDGNLETISDANGNKTKYTYNADSELTSTKEPSGAVTETEYDKDGQVISQTDGNKQTTKYVRNALEEVTEEANPIGRKTTREYDGVGNLIKLTDPEGRTTTYKYDPGNRLTEVSYSDGKTHSVKYEYDKDGDRIKMVDGTGTNTYTFDQLDRQTESKDGHGNKVKYEYDLDNEQTKITYPNAKAITRTYNKADRLEKITDWLSDITKFSYDPDGDLTVIQYPTATGDEDKYVYNEADQMSEVKMSKGSETLASLLYARDNDGQVKKTTSKGLPGEEVTEYSYDEDNRLTKAGSTTYEYDAANNPTKIGSNTYTYDSADELEKGGGVTYAYNEAGQRTKSTPTGVATTYGYNQAGDLISVERPKEGEHAAIADTYAYDGDGIRASQTISGTTAYLAWDFAESTPLMLNDGTNSFIYGPYGVPVEQIASEKALYLHHDQQGSIRLLTGSTGKVEATATFDAYGNKTGSTGTATTPLGYDAQYTNADTGLIYLRARVYDPSTAQYLTVDPIDDLTHAPYYYADDNPLDMSDPSGAVAVAPVLELCAEAPEVCALGAAAAGIGSIVVGKSAAEQAVEGSINWLAQQENSGDEGEQELRESQEREAECGETPPTYDNPPDRNPSQDRKLSDPEIEALAGAGDHPHDLKPGGSSEDLYRDREGNVYVKPKGGLGPGEPVGINMKELGF